MKHTPEDIITASLRRFASRPNAELADRRRERRTAAGRLPIARELSVKEGRELAASYPLGTSYCGQTATGPYRPYTCTRQADHVGDHVAHLPDGSAAAHWPNDERSTES